MKLFLFMLSTLLIGPMAQAVDCTVKDDAGYDYDITLKGNVIDVTTAGAGWDLTLDTQQSTGTTKYYSYQNPDNGVSLVFISENNMVSIYDYKTQNYYFANQPCTLPSGGSQKAPPPPGYRPGSGSSSSSAASGGGAQAIAMPGGQFTPLPAGPNGSYDDVNATFTRRRSIRNQTKHGIACDWDDQLKASFCQTSTHYLVVYGNRVELTSLKDGTQYMLPKQRISSCSNVGPFCEDLFAVDPSWVSVGVGHTDGIQLYVTVNGQTQVFYYTFPDAY